MKTYKYSICLLLFTLLTSCETEKLDILYYGTINGVVLDAETYLPVQGAMITTTPASVSLLSDAEGKFTIPKIKEGDVSVNIKKKDYLSNSLTVAVFDEETTQLDFLIFKDNNDIGNISIYDPVPGNGAVDQALAITLKWKVEGKKANVELAYNIYIFESNSTVQNLLGENIVLQEVTTSGLKASTTYFWYVVVKYEGNKVAFSPTWSFKTRDNL
ncbi:MAG: carboxypeptidase regulatory-like domain-containing protein [Paludibacter sp.]|nr:carboxypeptidase regulatory-like domain-containing protein [Paludibacter sp.]